MVSQKSSECSAINPSVTEGVHTLISPVPVFVLATGFQMADAYSFIPGTVAPRSLPDSTESVACGDISMLTWTEHGTAYWLLSKSRDVYDLARLANSLR